MLSSSKETLAFWPPPAPPSGVAARLLDVVVAAAVLVCFAPLMILVAAAIFFEDGWPIFFSQVRLGRHGQHFRIHKFRKFDAGASPAGRPLTVKNDPRLTVVGGFLARTKLDELPQLWNVLKGDMAIVGPRPESLDFQDCFDGPYGVILEHKPGIFGPSQILFRDEGSLYSGRSNPEQFYRDVLFPFKAHIDLTYFAHRTLFRDVALVIRGTLAVLGCSSTLQKAAILVEQVEDWNRKNRRVGRGLPSQIELLPCVSRSGVVEIVREGGGEIADARSDRLLLARASGRRYATDQSRASKDGAAPCA
jgi:lipopolysaccharide/colanic/teichoic acid biosynthesis glycosyltransferase